MYNHVSLNVVTFKARIEKAAENGWSYIIISPKLIRQLNPDIKAAFRVKGKLDRHVVEKTALLPLGDGRFMLPVNAGMRSATGKQAGDLLVVSLEVDNRKLTLSNALLKCLKDDPEALKFFKTLSPANQRYYSKWVDDAKTLPTKTKRITITLIALGKQMNYSQMLEAYKTFEV